MHTFVCVGGALLLGKTGPDKCRLRGGSFVQPSASATCTTVDKWRTRDVAAPDVGFRCCAS